MDDIRDEDRQVVNINTAPYSPWIEEDGSTAEYSYIQLGENFTPGVGFHIFKMHPGSKSTPHEHTGHEEFLVLEGELTDHDGYVYRQGDLVWLRKGTQHWSYTEHGCTLAVYIARQEKKFPEGRLREDGNPLGGEKIVRLDWGAQAAQAVVHNPGFCVRIRASYLQEGH